MIDPTVAWSLGFFTGLGAGLWLASRGPRNRAPFTRSPYSLSNIWLVATKEDADKFRSRFVDPSFGEPRPERMTVDQWARSCSKPRELLCFGEPVRVADDQPPKFLRTAPNSPRPPMTPDPKPFSETEIERMFREWWAQSWPTPPGTHALRTHIAWATHLLDKINESTTRPGSDDA